MATVEVYPREGTVYDDANGVPITSAGAIVEVSVYIRTALNRGYLLDWDPLDIYEPDDRTGISTGGSGIGSALQNQAALEAAALPASTDAVEVLGCLTAGDGGGCLYRRTTSNFPPVGVDGEMVGAITAGDGSIWVYVPDARGVNVRAFGALGEASTPEENVRGIQNALIFDMHYTQTGCTYIPAGKYQLSDTIQLGYGVSGFYGTTLEGDGPMFLAEDPFGGTALYLDDAALSDRPCIAVQGTRNARVRRLTLWGPNVDYVRDNALGTNEIDGSIDDTVLANWIGPGMHANCNSRYAPNAGIAIDPYSGVEPSPSYPDVDYPGFMGVVAQYGKSFSSLPVIEDVNIYGFVVPVVVQPCNADGNGDFVTLRDCTFLYNVYGAVSVGNTQSRTLQGDNVNAAAFHTGIANNVHGAQNGKIGCEWRNCNFGACIQWIDLTKADYAGPVKFVGCYGEQVYRIGNYGQNASGNTPLTFEACEFTFTNQDPTTIRGVPATCLLASNAQVQFRDCVFARHYSVAMLAGSAEFYSLQNCKVISSNARTNTYEKIAHNFLADGVMFGLPSGRQYQPNQFSVNVSARYDMVSGTNNGNATYTSPYPSSREIGLSAWVDRVTNTVTRGYVVPAPHLWRFISKATVTVSMSGKTLTVSGLNGVGFVPGLEGGKPGDVIWDDSTNTVFFIRSASSGSVIAEAQNNYRGTTMLTAIPTGTGNLYFGSARVYLPSTYIKGTFSTGSTTVSSVGRADGYGGALTSWIANGDQVYAWNGEYLRQYTFTDAACTVASATDGSPGSFALGSNPLTSETRDVGLFIRQAPANV